MSTVAVTIYLEESFHEFLIAELADLDFETFEQEEDYLVAYIPAARWNDVKREHIQTWLAARAQSIVVGEEVIQNQNWNQRWEETIEPVAVDRFLIKPTWHDVPAEHQALILLEIDPKMSFGTGYHESTRLMLRMLPDYVREGDRVLDAGTGTGILAVAAVKLGAVVADAFDIDPWAQQNAAENFYLNRVADRIRLYEGAIDVVPPAEYEVVLANINLNVILGLLGRLSGRLRPDGVLLVSGILTRDGERLTAAALRRKLSLVQSRTEGEWWCGALSRVG